MTDLNTDFKIIAHRGFSRHWPENTVYAFHRACHAAPYAVEFDIQHSSDGVPVVIHDTTVDRTTDDTGDVDSFTAAELGAMDATSHRSTLFAGLGGVPTLAEVIAVLQQYPSVERFYPELKVATTAQVDTIVQMFIAAGLKDRTEFTSFDPALLARARLLTDARLFLLVNNNDTYGHVDQVLDYVSGKAGVWVEYGDVDADFMAYAAARQVRVAAGAITATSQLDGLADAGLEYVFSDLDWRPAQRRDVGKAAWSFVGTSGQQITTQPVNLFDADTAHVHSGVGGWYVHRNASIELVASEDSTFGDNVLQWTVDATAGDSVIGPQGSSVGGNRVETAADTEYRVNYRVKGTSGMKVQIQGWVFTLNSGGSVYGAPFLSDQYTMTGEWEWITLVFTNTQVATYPWITASLYSVPARAGDVLELDVGIFGESANVAAEQFIPSFLLRGDPDWLIECATDRRAQLFASIWQSATSKHQVPGQADAGGGAQFYYSTDGSTTSSINPSYALYDDNDETVPHIYRHVVASSDGSYSIFKDGLLVEFQAGGGALSDFYFAPDAQFAIGSSYNGAASTFSGKMHRVELRDGYEGPAVIAWSAQEMIDHLGMQVAEDATYVDSLGHTWKVDKATTAEAYWPNGAQLASDAVMVHLKGLDSPPESSGDVGALVEAAGLSIDTEYRFALLSYMNLI